MKFQHGEGNANSDVNALTAVGNADATSTATTMATVTATEEKHVK